MRRNRFWPLLAVALVSCSKGETETKKARLTPPRDEASAEERQAIDETLSRIERLSGELGRPRSFRSLPVVLTTDDATYTDHPAACVFEKGGEPQFILIKRSVLDSEAQLRYAGTDTSLFRVLLHEIGHCYFARQHEEDRLYEDGKSIEISAPQGAVQYSSLDVTVMVPEGLTVPIPLEKYYVAELLGLARAKTIADFGAFAKTRLVRASELQVRP